jgi:phosphatidylglycerophosphatase A
MTQAEQPQTTVLKPTSQFMLAHPAHILALGFGSGLSRIMPGTAGTLFGWLCFYVLNTHLPELFTPLIWGLLIGGGFIIGVWACEITGRNLGVADHGGMVWDEIIAIWLVLVMISPTDIRAQSWAFVLFRFFDMVKPPPIRNIERRFKGGFGVMIDDIIAAFFTLLVIALVHIL